MLSNNQLEELWNDNFTVESGLNYLKLARAIESASRREALEDAAKVCDDEAKQSTHSWAITKAVRCARLIRELIEKQ